MALPPLPPNSTDRIFVNYTTGRLEHSFTVRHNSGGFGEAAVLDDIAAFLGALAPVLPGTWAVTNVEQQLAGSVVTLPLDAGPLDGFVGQGAGGLDIAVEQLQWNWIGRGAITGRKVRVGLYGINLARPVIYRFTGGGRPQALIEATNSLVSTSARSFLTVGGDRALWYDYVNVQFNSYWEAEARG